MTFSMEGLALRFLGAYTDLQEGMQFHHYAGLDDDDRAEFNKRTPDDKILRNCKRYCRDKLDVALPGMISGPYRELGPHRNDIAHLSEVDSIEGDPPRRVVTIIRYGDYTSRGEWAMQTRETRVIAEADLRLWISDLIGACKTTNVIDRLGAINAEFGLADDALIDSS